VESRPIPHIFVVDDERNIASSLTAILNMSGYRARFFVNPVEALAAARKEQPDLLISDVVMPELSGVDLAIQLKEQCPSCKVLLFSGQAATTDFLREARQQGHSFEVLAKPIHPNALLARIHHLHTSVVSQVFVDCPATVQPETVQLELPMSS
jgi:DNA-binding NtrC family response regulator